MPDPLIPFALSQSGNIVAADEVQRGLRSGCTCFACGNPLLARQGEILQWHFAHTSAGTGCDGGIESACHLLAKEAIVESQGKAVHLGLRNSIVQIVGAKAEVWVADAGRQPDVVARVAVRERQRSTKMGQLPIKWFGDVAIEIYVSNAKDDAYMDNMRKAGVPVYEKRIDVSEIYEMARSSKITLRSAVKRYVLTHNRGRWLVIEGLPFNVASCVNEYAGSEQSLVNCVNQATGGGDWQAARNLMMLGRSRLPTNRWASIAEDIALRHPDGAFCPVCLSNKSQQYALCRDCAAQIQAKKELDDQLRRAQEAWWETQQRERVREVYRVDAQERIAAEKERILEQMNQGQPIIWPTFGWDKCACGQRKQVEYDECYDCAFG